MRRSRPSAADAEPVEQLVAARVGRPDVGTLGRVERGRRSGRRMPRRRARRSACRCRAASQRRRRRVELALDRPHLGERRLEHVADAVVRVERELLREQPGAQRTRESTVGLGGNGGGWDIRPPFDVGGVPTPALAISRSSVDLPTPFSPIRPSRWPGATEKPRSVKTRRSEYEAESPSARR